MTQRAPAIPTLARMVFLSICLVTLGCAESTSGANPNGEASTEPTPEQLCTPGEARCTDATESGDATREVCSEDGMSWEVSPCEPLETCVDEGICQPPICNPGDRRCADDGAIEECAEDGSHWFVVDETCEATEICSGGTCVNQCEQALERSSYDGCEFHAVDLPQLATVFDRFDEFPFAVVLANPHDVPARVTITQADNVVVQLIDQQTVVEPDYALINPDDEPRSTVVYSEVRDAEGNITHIAGPAANIPIPPRGMGTFILPNRQAGMRLQGNSIYYENEVAPKAYRVTTDLPVTAYQFQPICCSQSFTNDATILFPTGSLGKRYRAVSLPSFNTIAGFISIVAGDQPTNVAVHMGNHYLQPSTDITSYYGNVATAQLEPYDVMTIFGRGFGALSTDLTGVEIVASEDVSVFGGHTCSNVPHAFAACDHLETSLMPVDSWQNEFVVAHTYFRSELPTEVNYYRIVADVDGTIVQTEPRFSELDPLGAVVAPLPTCTSKLYDGSIQLNAGEWCEFGTRLSFVIESTEPIQLVQLLTGSQAAVAPPEPESEPEPVEEDDGLDESEDVEDLNDDESGEDAPDDDTEAEPAPRQVGDPALTFVPPSAQFRQNYTFLTPDTFARNYVNVVHGPGAEIYLDGMELNDISEPDIMLKVHEESIGQSSWHLTILEVSSGPHFMTSPRNDSYGIMIYAYDRDVSYAFPGGLNLTKF